PRELKTYLDRISKEMRAPIRIVSVGRARDATIHIPA
ncbi:MAG: adenylosuccinate synthetase, partial [Methanobacteriota archaeon]